MPIAWKQFSKTILRTMAREGLPVGEVIKFLEDEGITFRHAEMLETYRKARRIVGRKDAYQYTPKKYRVPEALYEKPWFKLETDYFYEVTFKVRSKITGEEYEKFGIVESDFSMARSSIEAQALSEMKTYFEADEEDIIDYALSGSFKK